MTAGQGKSLGERGFPGKPKASFREFVTWLIPRLQGVDLHGLEKIAPLDLYSWAETAPISAEELTERLSEFSGVPYVAHLDEEDVDFRTLSRPFCQAKLVVPVKAFGSRQTVALSNPYDWGLIEDLERTIPRSRHLALLLASPETLKKLISQVPDEVLKAPEGTPAGTAEVGDEGEEARQRKREQVYDPEKDPGKGHAVARLAIALLTRAIKEEASDLLIEPRGTGAVARATIGGRVHDLQEVTSETGKMLVARFKALSGMDLAKKRTPQSGGLEILLDERVTKLRLTTAPTTAFEHLTIRVLDVFSEAGSLGELGLAPDQISTLADLANLEKGLILFVGPFGSGKTTSIYSLLSAMSDGNRTVLTVEDPVEHKIPFARQQEVGVDGSTRHLLHQAVQEGPDVLFLTEIKDLVTAQTCVDFARSGHLTITSMNSSNAATAVFRMERLGVTRSHIADVLIGVVAQRLLKRLCPECKKVRPISDEEVALLKPFTRDIPETVAEGGGCSSCRGTGYHGQEGVFEVIPVGPRMSQLIREGRPIAELREFAQARGDLLLDDHGIRKVRELVCTLRDVHRSLLLEEVAAVLDEPEGSGGSDQKAPEDGGEGKGGTDVPLMSQASILVVEDEEGTRFLLDQILSKAGYRVIQASDGGEALLKLGAESVDLILSDIHMPNLDGLKLLEILNQHTVLTPVVLLTGEPSPDVEARGWEMGVADYIRKPIQRDVLLERIQTVLETKAV